MKFFIEYNDSLEQRTLIYLENESSFDMEPWSSEIDFDIEINTLILAILNTTVIQLNGFCGLNSKMKADYNPPKSKKGLLKVLYSDNCTMICYKINKEDWPVYVNVQTGWVCIGFPKKSGKAVEFINNCVAVIDDNHEFVSLWLKPESLPDI